MNEQKAHGVTVAALSADQVALVHEKLCDAQTPGFFAEFLPEEADMAGAFEEWALGEADAVASGLDSVYVTAPVPNHHMELRPWTK